MFIFFLSCFFFFLFFLKMLSLHLFYLVSLALCSGFCLHLKKWIVCQMMLTNVCVQHRLMALSLSDRVLFVSELSATARRHGPVSYQWMRFFDIRTHSLHLVHLLLPRTADMGFSHWPATRDIFIMMTMANFSFNKNVVLFIHFEETTSKSCFISPEFFGIEMLLHS